MTKKPLPDLGRLVRALVVEDQMDAQIHRDKLIDVP